MAWLYLFLASIFEIAWTFCLQYMSVRKLKTLHWQGFFNQWENWRIFGPFAGYVLFGLGNIYFFSQAMKDIPASTALAVWMGTALIGVKVVEIVFQHKPYDWLQFLYMGFILIGIVGLKKIP